MYVMSLVSPSVCYGVLQHNLGYTRHDQRIKYVDVHAMAYSIADYSLKKVAILSNSHL